ncbi:IclR family transcriptional regulator domain-containing protein [Streptomyces subrutilus]|uniref:IclR family transcriptional regulator domain-containing protein n=1 Tax=Streptomyces subrutilus TaxID=36818 RepID=UPI00099FEEFE
MPSAGSTGHHNCGQTCRAHGPGPEGRGRGRTTAPESGGRAERSGIRGGRGDLATLRDAVGAAVYVSSYTDGEVHISRLSDGPQAPRVYEWVFRFAGHASAVGKSLLQQLPFEARMDHLARRHPVRLTPRTITDPARLFRTIDENGTRSAQFDWHEYSPREVCVAVPLSFGSPDPVPARRTAPPPQGSRPNPHRPVRNRPAQPPAQRQPTRRTHPAPPRRDHRCPTPPTGCS